MKLHPEGLVRRPEGFVSRLVFSKDKSVLRGAALGVILAAPVIAQTPLLGINGGVRINNSDVAVLETHEARKDLPCTVTPAKPELGFDLRFHTRYDVTVPINDLAGSENQLTILFRVTPAGKDDPSFFIQRIHVPMINEDTKGDATLTGTVD